MGTNLSEAPFWPAADVLARLFCGKAEGEGKPKDIPGVGVRCNNPRVCRARRREDPSVCRETFRDLAALREG